MDIQLDICSSCRHKRFGGGCHLRSCCYEPKLDCDGCIDHKKKKYKGTECLHCKRWCFSEQVIVKDIPDRYRKGY